MTKVEAKENFVRALLAPINPALAILLGVYTILWGLWVASPFWEVFNKAGLYSKLQEFAPLSISPEPFWGSLAIACGLVTCYGTYRRRYKPLVRGACVAGWHWFMITIFYFWGDWHNTGGITTLLITVYCAILFLNLRVNFKDDKENKHILH